MLSSVWRYEIVGRIIPERVDFNCSVPTVQLVEPNSGHTFEVSLSIQKSLISVKITSCDQISDFDTVRNIIRDFIRLYTDSYGYLHGYAYEVEIDSISGENNNPHLVFGVQINELELDFTNRPIQIFDEICKLMYSGNNHVLKIALNDLRLSIQHPTDTAMYCLRGVESLMQHFNNGDKDKAWEDLRTNLNISRSFIKSIEDKAWSPRHGKPVPISHAERVDIMKRTWKIVDRFIIFAKTGKPLDKSTYPEL